MQARTRLLAKPLGHPTLDFFVADDLAPFDGCDTVLNRLTDVDVVLNVFVRRIFR